MKIKFEAWKSAPEYDISGNVITAEYNGKSEIIDLSGFPEGGKWEGGELENITELSLSNVIVDVFDDGDIHVILCQKVPYIGHWMESDWIDADDYEKGKLYIKEVSNEG